MSQIPDPVSSPEAYRATLLAALGDDDGDLLRARLEPVETTGAAVP